MQIYNSQYNIVFYSTILQYPCCVFTGKHLHSTQLGYEPAQRSAVCSLGNDFLCVAEWWSTVLHIHRLSGQEVRRVQLQDLMWDESEVHGVCSSKEGRAITAVMGDSDWVNSVLLYQVNNLDHKQKVNK